MTDPGPPLHVVVCLIGDQHYAVAVSDLVEIAALVQITPLPDASPALLGVVNRHGSIIPMLDLRRIFGRQGTAPLTLSTMFLVAQGPQYPAGLVVDEVLGVITLPPGAVTRPQQRGQYVEGWAAVDGDTLLLLDVAALLDTLGSHAAVAEAVNAQAAGPGEPASVVTDGE